MPTTIEAAGQKKVFDFNNLAKGLTDYQLAV